MLSNSEFSAHNKIDTLTGDMADFAMFSLDMGECRKNGEVCFPHLQGKGINLWDVVPKTEVLPPKKVEVDDSGKQANLAKYISQGFAFDPMARDHADERQGIGEGEDDPQDEGNEWDKFFAVDTQPIGGKFRQKGRVKNLSSFEQFVDNSQ